MAEGTGFSCILADHIAMASLDDPGVRKMLSNRCSTVEALRRKLILLLQRRSRVRRPMQLTPRAKQVLELAIREMRESQRDYVGAEHLLVAVLREGGSLAAKVINESLETADRARKTWEKG